jgi:hypothetical protein
MSTQNAERLAILKEDIITQIELHQKHLQFLKEKAAVYGSLDTPIRLQIEIVESEKELQGLTKQLELVSAGQEVIFKKPLPQRRVVSRKPRLILWAAVTTIASFILGVVANLIAAQIDSVLSGMLNVDLGFLGGLFTIAFGLGVVIGAIYLYFENEEIQRKKLISLLEVLCLAHLFRVLQMNCQ